MPLALCFVNRILQTPFDVTTYMDYVSIMARGYSLGIDKKSVQTCVICIISPCSCARPFPPPLQPNPPPVPNKPYFTF